LRNTPAGEAQITGENSDGALLMGFRWLAAAIAVLVCSTRAALVTPGTHPSIETWTHKAYSGEREQGTGFALGLSRRRRGCFTDVSGCGKSRVSKADEAYVQVTAG